MMKQYSSQTLLNRLATAFCAIMMFLGLVASPTFAAGIPAKEQPNLPTAEIMRDAEDFANPDKKPMSMEEIQARSRGGLNEIQGTTDAEKMIDDSQPGKPDSALLRKMDKQTKKSNN